MISCITCNTLCCHSFPAASKEQTPDLPTKHHRRGCNNSNAVICLLLSHTSCDASDITISCNFTPRTTKYKQEWVRLFKSRFSELRVSFSYLFTSVLRESHFWFFYHCIQVCRPRYKHNPMSYGDREIKINHIL